MKYDEKPYDKAFRSMLADCRELILPLINEAFHENYTGDETIIPWQNDQVYWEEDEKKKLFFLLPFYIFNEEHLLTECRTKEESRLKLRRKLQELVEQVKASSDKNEITNYQKYVIMKTAWYVIQNLTKGEEREVAQKEAEAVMRGPVLEFEGTKIYREGEAKGEARGEARGEAKGEAKERLTLIVKKYKKGKTINQIAGDLEASVEEIREYYDLVAASAPDYDIDQMLEKMMGGTGKDEG